MSADASKSLETFCRAALLGPPDLYLGPDTVLQGLAARRLIDQGMALPLDTEDLAATHFRLWRRLAEGGAQTILLPALTIRDGLETTCPASLRDRLAGQVDRLLTKRSPWANFPTNRLLTMGIVNVTPDSFSDGGDHADAETAIEHGLKLRAAGADILDVGGESTRPGAVSVSPDIEMARILPVIKALAAQGCCVSVDTRHTTVMAAALDAGAQIINDVNGLNDRGAIELAARREVPVVLMHMQGQPETMQANPAYACAPLDIFDWFEERLSALEAAGGNRGQVLLDPGIGFGKTTAQNLELIGALPLFRATGCDLLLGVSRKGLIANVSSHSAAPKDRLGGSLALGLRCIANGARALRVHDAAETVQALELWQASAL